MYIKEWVLWAGYNFGILVFWAGYNFGIVSLKLQLKRMSLFDGSGGGWKEGQKWTHLEKLWLWDGEIESG